MRMKIAVLNDRYPSFGGGEYVATELAKCLRAPLYTTYISEEAKAYTKGVDIIPFKQYKYVNSFYSKLIHREFIETALICFDFEQLDLSDYNLIFSSGVLSRSYIPMPEQYVINYMHSPPRWLYDIHRERMNMLSWWQPQLLAKLWAQYWRTWDLTVNNYINQYVCNSSVTQKRVKRYFGRDSEVIHPPIYVKNYKWEDDCNYFLMINRLYPEKRIDIAIKAFQEMPDEQLYIVGSGDNRYQKLARNCKNIKFLGQVSEKQKQILLSNCSALISIPMSEDFGIAPIEAFASGKPVIGVKEGYTKFQIKPCINGLFVSRPTPLGLEQAINEFQKCDWDIEEIQSYAKQYDISVFKEKIKEVVKGYEDESR